MASTRLPNKPAAAGVAAPLAIVLVWIAGQFDVEMTPEVATAFSALLISGAYVLFPAGKE